MGTPAIASRDAKVWRRSCHEKSLIRARRNAGRKTRLMKFCELSAVVPLALGNTHGERSRDGSARRIARGSSFMGTW
jgi:hypothetical protein